MIHHGGRLEDPEVPAGGQPGPWGPRDGPHSINQASNGIYNLEKLTIYPKFRP